MAVILLVDDNSTIRRVVDFMLRALGHEVVTAANGYDALDQLQRQPCDLVIADLSMPEMDGLTLLRHIRVTPHLRTLPVVMLTASGEGDHQIVNDFLTKPTSKRALAETIERCL
jgi:two-component system, chemotaxis family, chemotaxis protein CheY